MVQRIRLEYGMAALSPAINHHGLDVHYNKNYKSYVEKFNTGVDQEFNEAGAALHAHYFWQLKPHAHVNEPHGILRSLIEYKHGSYAALRQQVVDLAHQQHGSFWIYMSLNGDLEVIPNHEKRDNILLLIDLWEHAYTYTHDADKEKYLSLHWGLINWEKLNAYVERRV